MRVRVKKHVCDFCGKDQFEVAQIIAGPNADICDECVDLSAKIIAERRAQRAATNKPA